VLGGPRRLQSSTSRCQVHSSVGLCRFLALTLLARAGNRPCPRQAAGCPFWIFVRTNAAGTFFCASPSGGRGGCGGHGRRRGAAGCAWQGARPLRDGLSQQEPGEESVLLCLCCFFFLLLPCKHLRSSSPKMAPCFSAVCLPLCPEQPLGNV